MAELCLEAFSHFADQSEFNENIKSIYAAISKRYDLWKMCKSNSSVENIFLSVNDQIKQISLESLPVAVALCMHYYPLCAIATIPFPRFHPANFGRASLFKRLIKEKAIVGNVGGERTYDKGVSIKASKTASGYLLNGRVGFCSLSPVADYIFLQAFCEEAGEHLLCLLPANSEGVGRDEYLFHDSMKLTATTGLYLTNCSIRSENYVKRNSSDTNLMAFIANYQRSWFHLLASMAYKHSGEYLLGKLIEFAKQKTTADGMKIIELTTFKSTIATLNIKIKTINLLIDEVKTLLVIKSLTENEKLEELYQSSILVKHYVTVFLADLSIAMYRFMGALATLKKEIANRLNEHKYLAIQPMSDYDILRYFEPRNVS